MAVDDVDLTPTSQMRDLARRGLDFHEEGLSGDGLAPATVTDARAIAAGEAVSPDKVVRMNAWFARHLPDLDAPANSDPDNDDFPGPGAVAWYLWAGDPTDPTAAGVAWSARKVSELEAEGYRSEVREDDEYDPRLTPRQRMMYDKYEKVAELFGQFDKSAGPDGAHYIEAADNVFADAGIKCAACVYFQGGGACEIVEGSIEPEAVCKLWVIPEGTNSDAPAYDDDMTMPDDLPEAVDPERSHFRGGVEWRESGAGKQYRVIRGYAAVWNSRSEDLGGFVEVLEPGAFRDALGPEADVALLYNHDDATIMARQSAGTLELEEDERGLRVWARVDMNDPDVARVVGKMNAGNVSQMSFRFTMNPGGDEWDTANGTPLRTIRSGGVKRLYEVTLTPFPAYPASKASVYERAIESGRLPTEAGAEVTAAKASPSDGATPEPRANGAGEDKRAEDSARYRASLWAARLSKHRNRSVQK
jgi:HK97 family phage prohead protease